ncbi:hypothetical protein EDD21DRAFT_138852 [Dissophora ornata]|nr:hypothetical protein EDD21DRAFT_138852 [Dissophora ornata]
MMGSATEQNQEEGGGGGGFFFLLPTIIYTGCGEREKGRKAMLQKLKRESFRRFEPTENKTGKKENRWCLCPSFLPVTLLSSLLSCFFFPSARLDFQMPGWYRH